MTTVSALPEVTIGPDRLGRSLRDVRISVTDRCNFRCPYCMPKARFGPGYQFLPRAEALDAREIVRLAGVFASLGVTKIRLTGGEPLLRPDLVDIVEGIAKLGVPDIALTTNGALLRRWAARLRDAGLQRVTVSLDSLDPTVFASMSDSRIEVSEVLDGIAAAREAGLAPIKLNCVVQRGVNEQGLLDLVGYARREGLGLRCIEYMDVGATNGWRMADVVSGEEILERVRQVYPLLEETPDPAAVARTYRFADGNGDLGVITSVSRPFCGDCTRARLGVDGKLYTCLFATAGIDLREPMRSGADDDALRRIVADRWKRRDDRYSELRGLGIAEGERIEMSYIGG
ncbi:MAG TPA: GTP 3',8-cyclase MoaA [Candidatus Saccharimonadales bacterium]|nr:GTP 3',8-cyclase MoaA [Candidatus Saccharimonadales bacterium]